MGFYWRRSTKILPGVRINWSKSGSSVSVGPRGAKLNFSKRGTYASGSIPGTGMYYRKKIGGKNGNSGNNPTTSNTYYNGTNIQNQQISTKGCIITLLVFIGIALLLTGNFITCAFYAGISVLLWFIYKILSKKSISSTNQNITKLYTNPQQHTQDISLNQDSTPNKQVADVNLVVAEVEHLIKQIDSSTDRIKLPSYYRRLMSIICSLEKEGNITIYDMPIEEVKRRVLENYRKKMN